MSSYICDCLGTIFKLTPFPDILSSAHIFLSLIVHLGKNDVATSDSLINPVSHLKYA